MGNARFLAHPAGGPLQVFKVNFKNSPILQVFKVNLKTCRYLNVLKSRPGIFRVRPADWDC